MKQSEMQTGPLPIVAVSSPSPLMLRRLCRPLAAAGFKPFEVSSLEKLIHCPRQSPFIVCFLDLRGVESTQVIAECVKARPAERYIFIKGDANAVDGNIELNSFGSLTDSFTDSDIAGLAIRAAAQERLEQQEAPLEELLYLRFCSFLQQLGRAPMDDLYELVRERVDRPLLNAVMQWADGNQSKASELLGIHRNTLRTKLKSLGVDKK